MKFTYLVNQFFYTIHIIFVDKWISACIYMPDESNLLQSLCNLKAVSDGDLKPSEELVGQVLYFLAIIIKLYSFLEGR